MAALFRLPSRRVRFFASTASVLALVLALAIPGVPSAASMQKSGTARLTLVSQPSFYEPGDKLGITLRITNSGSTTLNDLSLVVSAYDRVSSRSALHEAEQGDPGFATSSFPKALNTKIAPGESAVVEVNDGMDSLPTLSQASSDGVYPLAVSLFDGTESDPLDTLYLTAVMYLSHPEPPLNLVLVVPVNSTPEKGPEGTYIPVHPRGLALESAIAPSGWMRQLLSAINDVRQQSDRLAALKQREEHALQAARKNKKRQQRRAPSLPDPNAITVPSRLALALAPTPETVAEVEGMTHGFNRVEGEHVQRVHRDSAPAKHARKTLELLRKVLRDRGTQMVLTPYSYADLPSMVRYFSSGQGVAEQVAQARTSLKDTLGIQPSDHWFFPPSGRLGSKALEQLSLASSGEIRHTFFSSSSIRGSSSSQAGCPAGFGSLACPVRVDSEQPDSFTGFVTDPDLQATLDELAHRKTAPLAIQRFLAETTMIREESPGAGGRVVQATLPAFWSPESTALRRFFKEIALAPWLKTVTPARALHLTDKRATKRSVHSMSPSDSQPPKPYFDEIIGAQSAIEAFSSMDPPPDVLARLHNNTLIAQDSAWWRSADLQQRGESYPNEVQTEINQVLSTLGLVTAKDITLTSKRGRIRLDLANNADYPLRVTLHLSAQKLTFASGTNDIRRNLSIKGGGQRAMDFKVASQASGVSNVKISVETPDGARVVTTRSLTVRSTNFNQIAIFITLGALAFLILFFATRPLRRRRRREAGDEEQRVQETVGEST